MTVAIVDYGSGNLHSAAKAFERAARESGVTQPIVVTESRDYHFRLVYDDIAGTLTATTVEPPASR